MKIGKKFYLSLIFLVATVGAITAGTGIKPKYHPSNKAAYIKEADLAWIEPGLTLDIQNVGFSPPNVVVTFRISDDQGRALDRLGIDTIGAVATSFVLSRIKPGDTQFTSYITRIQTSPITNVSATQATTDSGGTYASLGDGVYKYTLGFKLPANFEVDATHRLGMYATRNLTTQGLSNYVANKTLEFVPSGGAVTQTRDVVSTQACNQCHDPLSAHGGARTDTKVCVLCHNPGTTDPDTGNTVDFKVMIHKIHMGTNLPSVSGKPLSVLGISGANSAGPYTGATQPPIAKDAKIPGKPYQIIGFNQSVVDFSKVVWPQDVRNCTTCHQGASQADNWKTNPTRAACGSCHDDVDFVSGKNHPGGPQLDDATCSVCHQADTGVDFDLSVAGSHTIPTKAKALKGLKVTLVEVTNAKPGSKPTVSFTVKDNSGAAVDVSKLDSFGLTLGGPTTDYTWYVGPEDARKATATPTGYTYTFTGSLPADAKGTYAVAAQGYRLVTYPGSLLGQSFTVRESFFNPVSYFGINGAAPDARRLVVDVKNCNNCHNELALHGGARRNTQYCVMCHNPNTQDPAGQTVNFRTHIHRIHTGAELANDWTISGRSYNGLEFPGDRRNCNECHAGNSFTLPLPDGLADTKTPLLFYSPLKPAASACLGCHDNKDAAAHAYIMTSPFGESCATCHEEGAEFAVSKVHAR